MDTRRPNCLLGRKGPRRQNLRAEGYFYVGAGAVVLALNVADFVSGVSGGFAFSVWNLELRGVLALIAIAATSLVCIALIAVGLRKIRTGNQSENL